MFHVVTVFGIFVVWEKMRQTVCVGERLNSRPLRINLGCVTELKYWLLLP